MDTAAASLFFQLIANRYETGSVIVTSNLAFSRWGETLGDDVVAAATIDRLLHHAHVIAMDGESYRTHAHRPGPPPTTRTKATQEPSNRPKRVTFSSGKEGSIFSRR